MNPFQLGYAERLKEWKNLRIIIRGESLDKVCVHVDSWWQQAPMIKHHMHPHDTGNWSDPWTILSENTYCPLTRAIGVCYTLLMSDVNDVQLVLAKNYQCEEQPLVIVGKRYMLNYWPGTVLTNKVSDFTITEVLSIHSLKSKI